MAIYRASSTTKKEHTVNCPKCKTQLEVVCVGSYDDIDEHGDCPVCDTTIKPVVEISYVVTKAYEYV